MTGDIGVLVVEDQPSLAELHREYVDRVVGFATVAVARTGGEALAALASQPVDLVLLDLYLPDRNGLEVCRMMRTRRHTADVIAITSARDLGTVREAMALGVVHYILKPFAFSTLRERLRRYLEYRSLVQAGAATDQHEVDNLLVRLLDPGRTTLPKNLRPETMSVVTAALCGTDQASASDVAAKIGASRVTARRYLEHLVREGAAEQTLRYGRTGRPEVLYRWRHETVPH